MRPQLTRLAIGLHIRPGSVRVCKGAAGRIEGRAAALLPVRRQSRFAGLPAAAQVPPAALPAGRVGWSLRHLDKAPVFVRDPTMCLRADPHEPLAVGANGGRRASSPLLVLGIGSTEPNRDACLVNRRTKGARSAADNVRRRSEEGCADETRVFWTP